MRGDPTRRWPDPAASPRDPAVTRIGLLLTAIALLSATVGLAPGWSATVGRRLHLILETVSATLAVVIGALALVRFSSGRRPLYLLVGAAFLSVAALDAVHAASFAVDPLGLPGPIYRVLAWSWLASRSYLALHLWIALTEARTETESSADQGRVFVWSGVAVLIVLVASTALPPESTFGPPLIPRPLELIPGGLFALTAIRLLRRPGWTDEVFQRWMVQFLIVAAAGHLVFAARSAGAFDLLFTGAHALKLLGYGAILVGILAGVRMTFRREEEALGALKEMNDTLGGEVAVRRDAEFELAESRASLAAVVESTGDSIWSVDREMRLVTFNTAFSLALETRSGREAEVGDPPEKLFGPADAGWYRDAYARALRGERFSELRSETMAGQERVYEVFCHPITGSSGISGAVMFGKDVTRRVRAEEALRMAKEEAEGANRAKSQFLANMSHELRTPLNSVIGFTNILLKNKAGTLNERDLGFLERVLANGRHLLSLINEVLDLAKIEAGRMELEVAPVSLPEFVAETVAQLEGQAREKAVALTWQAPEGLAEVETDAAKLRQVLINLVGNALKFSAGGQVTVRVLARESEVRGIAVQDTGVGIPQDRLDAIFEAFQQADGSTTREYGGTGLGLAISRSICQLLGYDLEVESEVGKGSTFTIRMAGGARAVRPGEAAPHPSDQEPVPAEAPPATTRDESEGRGLAVLVVDDESDSRVLMAHHLRDLGCRVFTAASAEEGIETARSESPDLITLDLMMPGMSGWEALHALKRDPATRSIPVVVVSIVAEESRGRLLGAVDLLTKPVEREDLLRVLWRNRVRSQRPRVLVVDDEAEPRERMVEALQARGLEVTPAPNGREALRLVQEAAPDAVVLDWRMPVMDGMGVLNRLRQDRYHTGLPVIVVADRELTRSERVALQEKAHSVVAKGPEHLEELLRILSWILPLDEAHRPSD